MRIVKIKVLAVSLLLISFITAGAMLIWQEATPEKNATAQNGFAVYFYQNPLEAERQDAPDLKEKQMEPRQTHASFVLWLLGMPLAVLGGLAVGLTLRGRHTFEKSPRRQQVIIVNPPRVEEFLSAVPKKLPRATQQDNSNFIPVQRARNARNCRMRFRSVAPSARRENQPR